MNVETPITPTWYALSTDEALRRLSVDPDQGLPAAEAEARLERFGPNALIERGGKKPWRILWEQLTGTLVVILIVAAAVSAIIGDTKDAVAILAIVVLNAILGFVQEYRAEQAMAALKKLAVPAVRVRRDGQVQELPAPEIAPGDVVLLEAGNLVPADGRLLEAANLRIQEAILTGESEPIEKMTGALHEAGASGEQPGSLPLGDQRNMAFMGTIVTYGRGQLLVTSTGMQTQLGHVAELIQEVDAGKTPLQRRLSQLGRALAVAALALMAVIFAAGLLVGEPLDIMIMTAISMAVAVVPEGLPAVVTIALALGAQRMLKRRALIRKLPAVETLGSVTVICSDKTGTLTENRMTVTILDLAGHRLDLTEQFRHREPVLVEEAGDAGKAVREQPSLALLLAGGALSSDAILRPDGTQTGHYHAVGDPTEGALVVAAARFGLWKDQLDADFVRIAEVPFDSERKRMTTVHRVGDKETRIQGNWEPSWRDKEIGDEATNSPDHPLVYLSSRRSGVPVYSSTSPIAFTKGAVDGLLEISSEVWTDGATQPLDATWRRRISDANADLASKGMRVLGIAFRSVPDTLSLDAPAGLAQLESNLTFVGLVGMIDPPRPEVRAAVETCRAAGIRPVMITGDHPLTARQIAFELGISPQDGRVLTGQDLTKMTVDDLEAVVEEISVYARVSPEHKLNIVQALQKRGHVVAMTGDGVNDAPALKRADIGVAMGITGTDVSKEAAEMVLLDDNFTTIVAAVEEGRAIYDNIRKFIKFSLAGNLGKVLTVLVAPLLGMPLPFTPFQILWMNLVTDGVLGLGMSVEPPERDTMRRSPISPKESIFARGLAWHIVWLGVLIGLIALGIGLWAWSTGQAAWQTMVLSSVIFAQIFQALAIRSSRDSLFTIGLLSNKPLLAAAAAIFVLQLGVIYLPFTHSLFNTVPLTAGQLAITIAASSIILWAVELEKWWRRRSDRRRGESAQGVAPTAMRG